MANKKKNTGSYFAKLDLLEQKMFKAEADIQAKASELSIERKKAKAILSAAALRAAGKNKEISKDLDEELKKIKKQETNLKKRMQQTYLKFLKAKENYQTALPKYNVALVQGPLFDAYSGSKSYSKGSCLIHYFLHGANSNREQLTDMRLLRYQSYSYQGINVEMPDRSDVEANQPMMPVRIKVQGGPTGNNTIANSGGQIWWGLEISQPGCGIDFDCYSSMNGFVHFDTCDEAESIVWLRLGIQVRQYRGYDEPLSEYDPNTWYPCRIWHAFPENNVYGNSSKTKKITPNQGVATPPTGGWASIEPFVASLKDAICDIQVGDKFIFWYSFGAQTDCSEVWLINSAQDTGLLLVSPPYVNQFSGPHLYKYEPFPFEREYEIGGVIENPGS